MRNDPSLKFIPVAHPNLLYLAVTNTFAPFDDVDVRKALAMGTDRQRIVDPFFPDRSLVLPTSPLAQQHQKDVINKNLMA